MSAPRKVSPVVTAPATIDYVAELKKVREAEKALKEGAKAAGVNVSASALPSSPERGSFDRAELVAMEDGSERIAFYFVPGNGNHVAKDGRTYKLACNAFKGGETIAIDGMTGQYVFGGCFLLEARK